MPTRAGNEKERNFEGEQFTVTTVTVTRYETQIRRGRVARHEVNSRAHCKLSVIFKPSQRPPTRSSWCVIRRYVEVNMNLNQTYLGVPHCFRTAGHKIPAIENLGVTKV